MSPILAGFVLVLASSPCQSKDEAMLLESSNKSINIVLQRNPSVEKQICELTEKRKFALAETVCKHDIEAIKKNHDVNSIKVRHILANRYWSMARINQELKKTNESEECYKQAVALWPEFFQISYEYGHFLMTTGKLERGLKIIEETQQAEGKEKSTKMAL